MIENRHLRYFLEVAHTLHITRAAEKLHIAQPALTQNIKYLEQELGVALFDRKGKRLSLTPAGKVFRHEAEHSLQVFHNAQLAAQRAARGEVGKVVIGFQSTAGLTVIPHLLKQLSVKYPDIEVTLHELGTTAQRKALRRGEIDAAIMYTLPDHEFSHHPLPPDPLIVAMPESHPLAAQESIALSELAGDHFVLPAAAVAEVLHNTVLAECAALGFRPRHLHDVSTAQTALGIVSAGFGISILPAAIQDLPRKGVVFKTIRNSRLQVQMTLMWPLTNASPIIPKILECFL